VKTLQAREQTETLADALLDVVDALEVSVQAQLRAFEGRVGAAITARIAAGAARVVGFGALAVAWATANAAIGILIAHRFGDVAALLAVSLVHVALALLLFVGARRLAAAERS